MSSDLLLKNQYINEKLNNNLKINIKHKNLVSSVFVRIKKHKDKEYAYLVENIWTKKGTRQKSRKYLGRIVDFSKSTVPMKDYLKTAKTAEEFEIEEFKKRDFDSAIKKLLEIELLKLGFKKKAEFAFEKEFNGKTFNVDLKELNFVSGKKNFVIKNNEGFICRETIENLLGTRIEKKESETEQRNALIKELLKNLLEAGLKPEKDFLLLLHDKCLEKISNTDKKK
ncbi:MAG: hypothetical protein ACP5H9_02435 [Candidatus Woesearchaeota archaeon]